MKNMNFVSLLSLALILGAPISFAAEALVRVPAPVDHVFAPKGFDTNDQTQVIVSGYLPNLCYKNVKSEVEVMGKTVNVSVTTLKDVRPGVICLEVMVPYLEVVTIGMLDKGEYSVVVNGNSPDGGRLTMIGVDQSVIGDVDDHIYADVESIKKTEGSRTVKLEGYLPSSCLQLDKIEAVSNGLDTYSVLPIMKQVDELCPMKLVPFSYEFKVPTELSAKQVLLHVRALKGRSVNTLFENTK